MKSGEDWARQLASAATGPCGLPTPEDVVATIESAQREAWNEAVEKSVRIAEFGEIETCQTIPHARRILTISIRSLHRDVDHEQG